MLHLREREKVLIPHREGMTTGFIDIAFNGGRYSFNPS